MTAGEPITDSLDLDPQIFMSVEDAGELIYRCRPSNVWRSVLIIIAIWVVGMAALTPLWGAAQASAIPAGVSLGLILVFVGDANLVHEVRERALVLRINYFVPRRRVFVVPLITIDPVRVRLNWGTRRLRNRMLPEQEFGGGPTLRVVSGVRQSVTFFGAHREFAYPYRKPWHFRSLAGKTYERPVDEHGIPGVASDVPLELWAMGVRDPGPLLRALETALIGVGRTDARGMAAWVEAHPVRERRRPPLTDREIYGPTDFGTPW